MNVMTSDASQIAPASNMKTLSRRPRLCQRCRRSSYILATKAPCAAPSRPPKAGIIKPIFVGPAAKITDTAVRHGLNIAGFELVDVPHSEAAAAKAVELIHAARGEMLMKGSLHTDELMRSVTAKASGLRTERRISHVFVMDVPAYAIRCLSPMPRSTSSRIWMANGTSSRTPSISIRKPASARCRGLLSCRRSRP